MPISGVNKGIDEQMIDTTQMQNTMLGDADAECQRKSTTLRD